LLDSLVRKSHSERLSFDPLLVVEAHEDGFKSQGILKYFPKSQNIAWTSPQAEKIKN
jgi:hypothetical protein